MKFYHGTTLENWKLIQEEGILFGRRYIIDNDGNKLEEVSRCTYLTPMIEEARCYGDVVLEVEYEPYDGNGNKKHNNYIEDCWQFRVYEPISIKDVKLIEVKKP